MRDEALFLLRGAPLHQGGSDQRGTRADKGEGGVHALQLLVIDDAFEDTQAAPAVLARPVDTGPAARREFAIPAKLALPVGFVLLESPRQRLHPFARGVGLKPGPELVAKSFILGAVVEVHRRAHLLPDLEVTRQRLK